MADKHLTLDGKGSRGEDLLEYVEKLLKQSKKPAKASGKSNKSDKKKGK